MWWSTLILQVMDYPKAGIRISVIQWNFQTLYYMLVCIDILTENVKFKIKYLSVSVTVCSYAFMKYKKGWLQEQIQITLLHFSYWILVINHTYV